MSRPGLAAALLFLACGDAGKPGFSTGPGVTTVSPSSGGPSDPSPTSTSTSTSPSTSSDGTEDSAAAASTLHTEAFDMGLSPDFGEFQPEGCKGKIDFLFVISRGFTMEQEQERLLASLPGFMATIEDSFAGYEPHIMVANPDGDWAPDWCDANLCPEHEPNCGPGAEDYVCYVNESETFCDHTLGAGLLFNAGANATNHACQLPGGHRYIIPDEEDAGDFECIASVGYYGPNPPMRDALFAAVQPGINGPGGCNEGFLRADALLVVTMIFDVQDNKSGRTPKKIYEAVVAAKGGDPDAVVMLVITWPTLNEPFKPDCTFGDYPDPLKELALLFPYHVIGNACADSYTPYLELAAHKVSEACGKFIPQ